MSHSADDDTDRHVADLDAELRSLEADGRRDSERFGELSKKREQLLNSRDRDATPG